MPAEIRAKIYPDLLIKSQHNGSASTATQSQVHVTANDKSICRCPQGVHCQHSDVWSSPSAPGRCSAIGPPGVTSVLRVCKQLYEEAVSVLYGGNIFVIEDIVKFRKFFVDHPRGVSASRTANQSSSSLTIRTISWTLSMQTVSKSRVSSRTPIPQAQ